MKDRRVWIVIACILAVGCAVTYYTSHLTRGQVMESAEEAGSTAAPYAGGASGTSGESGARKASEASLERSGAAKGAGQPSGESAGASGSSAAPGSSEAFAGAKQGPDGALEPEAEALDSTSEAIGNAESESAMDGAAAMAEGASQADVAAEPESRENMLETVKSPLETAAAMAADLADGSSQLEISPLTGGGSSAGGPGAVTDYMQRLEDLDAQIQKMREEEGGSNVYSIKTSAETELRMWEGEVNSIYNALLERLPREKAEVLSREQQEWLKNRDAQAAESTQKGGGSMETFGYTATLVSLTRDRAYALAGQYEELG